MLHTPVAFLVFNRPTLTEQVFDMIRQARPAQLLIVADGPRMTRPEDLRLCQEVRRIVSQVDWPCEVFRNYADTNLGCKQRVSSGLAWVFQTVEQAIILEDDCLPVSSFFLFCEELLERYHDDTRIMQICGNNLAGSKFVEEQSYTFSKIGPIWGWASWRRAWKYYDVEMKLWPQTVEEKLYENFWDLPDEVDFRFPLYQEVYNHAIDTWDIQWGFAKFIHAGLSIIPKYNLISNIGFDDGAESTHTVNPHHPLAKLPCHELSFPLQHPSYLIRNKLLEQAINDMLAGKGSSQSQHHVEQKVESFSPIRIGFLTSRGVNVGDEFIREGIRAILEGLNVPYTPLYVHKLSEISLHTPDEDEVIIVNDKYWDADLFIQSGAPVYWHLLNGISTSLNSDWHQWIWEERILKNKEGYPVFINFGAGSCQPWGDMGDAFLNDAACVQFARAASERASLTTVRDPVADHLLNVLQLPHKVLPCPAFLAACRHHINVPANGVIGVNFMPLGAHYDLVGNFDSVLWQKQCFTLSVELRRIGHLVFIAHDQIEAEFMAKFVLPGERIFLSGHWRDYFDIYAACSVVVANRVHGAVCAAGFGVPSIILGNDTRAMIGDYIGIPRYHVRAFEVTQVIQQVHTFFDTLHTERSRLLDLRNTTMNRYQDLLAPIVNQVNISRQNVMKEKMRQHPPLLALASVAEVKSAAFEQFMQGLNGFATQFSLRTFTNWSKVWEYPWLWFHGLSSIDWPNMRVLDFGSELSPMPWFFASLGAHVTIVETAAQWIPAWEQIKLDTGLGVKWKILPDEQLPFTDQTFDVVTSFSVIEHQRDKMMAVNEVVRVLKPGGLLAISFDICESEMGMTFPAWNGKALNMQEFEQLIWEHSELETDGRKPQWNVADCAEFIQWHLQSAPHHNYTVGTAILSRKNTQ